MRQAWLPVALFLGAVCGVAASARAAIELPEPQVCPKVEGLELGAEEATAWSDCERWAWSCIRQGLEANFFVKQCVEPRKKSSKDPREKYRFAPFIEPDRYKDHNAISSAFVFTVLSKKAYANAITPLGIRFVGAYFAEELNLENIATDRNLVLDQSMFKKGIRLTNFRSERNVSLDGSNVRDHIHMKRASIQGSLFLEEGVYDIIDASDARFGASIDGPSSVFNGPFRLDRVKVEGKVSFVRARLTEFTAWDTHIGSKLELRYAHVRGRIDLTGSKIDGDLRMQRLEFGREVVGHDRITCDWDFVDGTKEWQRFVFNPELPDFKAAPELHRKLMQEVVYGRPARVAADYPCVKVEGRAAPRPTQHEVLLRDMKIGGALCLIELTGEIAPPAGPPPADGRKHKFLSAIHLDGTEARSTILRWKKSPSDTLWQAVHYRTQNMFIDLGEQPKRHFIDNLSLGNISFIRRDARDEIEEQSEESRAYLCDLRPGPNSSIASDRAETHARIIGFFNSQNNAAKSAQPFAEIVARLNDSNAASTNLKMALSEYKLGKVCTSSKFYKERGNDPSPPVSVTGGVRAIFGGAFAGTQEDFDEARNVVLDTACHGGLVAYKWSVAYGHQLHNIVLVIAIFVIFFRLLLLLDRRPAGVEGVLTPRLGILYSIDMFTPFVKLNPAHSELKPNWWPLRGYLIFHRVVGLLLTSLLAIGIYAARF